MAGFGTGRHSPEGIADRPIHSPESGGNDMRVKNFLAHFAVTFVLAFAVSAVVSWLWSAIAHGAGAVDWESSVRLAVILGLVMPLATGGKRSG